MTWNYDAAFQLLREQRTGTTSYDITYTYDAVGNRIRRDDDGTVTEYVYNRANQLVREVTGAASIDYTYNGVLIPTNNAVLVC